MKRFNLLPLNNFQRNARGGHFAFQNEANFSPREACPPMMISCNFGEPSWCSFPVRGVNAKNRSTRGGGVANAKPK